MKSPVFFSVPPLQQRVSSSKQGSKSKKKKAKKEKRTIESLQKKKPPQQKAAVVAMDVSDDIDPREILRVHKRRKIEEILTHLGLIPIRMKKHTTWRNPHDPRIQTEIPNHPDIKKGTRHAIFKQITNREPTCSMSVKK